MKSFTEREIYPNSNSLKAGEVVKPIVTKKDYLLGKYLVSNYGRVWSLVWGKWMSPQKCPKGYLRYEFRFGIKSNMTRYRIRAHRLVLMAFCGMPEEGTSTVDHINGNKHDNRFENLEWVSVYENVRRQIVSGRHSTIKDSNRQKYLQQIINN